MRTFQHTSQESTRLPQTYIQSQREAGRESQKMAESRPLLQTMTESPAKPKMQESQGMIRKKENPGDGEKATNLRSVLKSHPKVTPGQVQDIPAAELIQTKEYKDLMNEEYVWQKDFKLTSEQAIGICYTILTKIANGEPFTWKYDTRKSIVQKLQEPKAPAASASSAVTDQKENVASGEIPAAQTTAPPPAQTALDYTKLLADKKLDIGIGIGYEFEDEVGGIKNTLIKKGITETSSTKGKCILSGKIKMKDPASPAEEIEVEVNVTLISSEDKTASKDFGEVLSTKEVVIYSGHARHGVGPDFDQKWFHTKGNFKIQSSKKGKNDLKKLSAAGKFDINSYQVWFFNACTSIDYLDEINTDVKSQDGKIKPDENLAVVASSNPVQGDARPFLEAILNELSQEELLKSINQKEYNLQEQTEKARRQDFPKSKPQTTYKDSFKIY